MFWDEVVLDEVVFYFLDALRRGGLALRKPNGGVRGIVAGATLRSLVARMVAQQHCGSR